MNLKTLSAALFLAALPAFGQVTSVGMTVPPFLTVTPSTITTSGTFAVTFSTGQISHKVIGTCGTNTQYGPCILRVSDLPLGYTWDSLGDPGGNLALTMAGNTSTFTYGATTGANDLFTLVDTASNTGTGVIFHTKTASGSTAIPFQADANGVGWQVDAAGVWKATGATTSGSATFKGSTSGQAAISVAAVAGTPNTILLPSTTGTVGQVLRTDGGNPQVTSWMSTGRAIEKTFDGNGSALTAGKTMYTTVPYACTIKAWNISVDTGTATVDVWKIANGTANPTVTNTITASAIPAISTGTHIHSTTLTGWTTTVNANDIVAINLKTVASATQVNMVLQCDQQ
jgi:hypothetical protein